MTVDDFIPQFPAAKYDLKCGDCGSLMACRPNKEGKPFYGCSRYPECRGTHGALPDGRPVGIPADKATRKARIEAHKFFDMLWKAEDGKAPRMTRNKAYSCLRKKMKMSETEAHFGKFDLKTCQKVVAVVKKEFPGVRTLWDRLGESDFLPPGEGSVEDRLGLTAGDVGPAVLREVHRGRADDLTDPILLEEGPHPAARDGERAALDLPLALVDGHEHAPTRAFRGRIKKAPLEKPR